MTGREQARLLGLFFWIFTGFQLFVVALFCIVYVAIFGMVFTQIPHKPNEPGPEILLPILIVIMAIVFGSLFLFSVPKLIAGYGLRREKSWARVWAIVACCMAVMSIPFGTALGVWGLIFLFGDEGKRYFESPEYGRLDAYSTGGINPPAPNSWQ